MNDENFNIDLQDNEEFNVNLDNREPENFTVDFGEVIRIGRAGGAVDSVNGKTGDVILTTSDLENTSDYQTGTEVANAISSAVATETENRQTADNGLQSQIDAITASSDVTDIVGSYAALEAYDTSKLNDNDIIKVLQDETHSDETTYYRWHKNAGEFTLIGEEGPYYTKSQTDTLLNAKQNTLTAGTNISINNGTISATDTTYSAGSGLGLTGTTFSVDTTTIATVSYVNGIVGDIESALSAINNGGSA